jgi:CRP/FNR family cyclic AMP-dependent transcriptional regulator
LARGIPVEKAGIMKQVRKDTERSLSSQFRQSLPEDLANISLFSDLSEKEVIEIAKAGDFLSCVPGEYLIREKDLSRDFYVLISGKMEVTRTLYAGDEKELGFIEPGEFFGEMAFLDGSPRSASVVCREKAVVFKLSREAFQHLVAKKPRIAYKMINVVAIMLTLRLRKSNDVLENLFSNPNKAILAFKTRLLKIQTMLQKT